MDPETGVATIKDNLLEYGRYDNSSEGTIDGSAVTVDGSFTNVLPSVHLNVDLAEDVKGRIALSTGVNRPTYNEWRASAAIDAVNGTVSGGNPALEAEEAWGATERVDLTALYQLPWDFEGATISLYLNANNLTDEVDVRYDANHQSNQVESSGKRYLAGIRVNF